MPFSKRGSIEQPSDTTRVEQGEVPRRSPQPVIPFRDVPEGENPGVLHKEVPLLGEEEGEPCEVYPLLVHLDLREVPDPYYGGEQGFEYVFDIVNQACDAVVKRIAEIEKQTYGR